MKSINIPLQSPIRIIPLEGDTTVNVVSTGDYIISKSACCEPRPRPITLADTGKATLCQSPQGMHRTMKIILASEEASEEEFVSQAKMLFRKLNAGQAQE